MPFSSKLTFTLFFTLSFNNSVMLDIGGYITASMCRVSILDLISHMILLCADAVEAPYPEDTQHGWTYSKGDGQSSDTLGGAALWW